MADEARPNVSCPIPDRSADARTREILGKPRTVAVVGMSRNRSRPSNEVARYLHAHGFTIVPVHPREEEIEGMRAYPDLFSIPRELRVEIVDLFVAGEHTTPIVEQAARIGASVVWFQPGVENPAAETRARELGLEVISGKCTMAEHRRLFD